MAVPSAAAAALRSSSGACAYVAAAPGARPAPATVPQCQHLGAFGGRRFGSGAPAARPAPRGGGAAAQRAATAAAVDASLAEYEAVIGIECHMQLSTATKAFCGCANAYGAPPNTHVCPVCLGHPGTLPVLSAGAVRRGVQLALALGCTVHPDSKFDRKQYFYPDLPKGYQISQYDEPLGTGGRLEVPLPAAAGGGTLSVGITRVHLEEDAGKLVYGGAAGGAGGDGGGGGGGGGGGALAGSGYSLVDFNRAGVPLLEIVSEPDMRTGAQAAAFGAELRRVARFLGASDGNMDEGSLRCDVNVSVRRRGDAAFGTRVEVKNMNSFSNVQRAIEFETARQAGLLAAGRGAEVRQETRLWDEARAATVPMRSKEGLADYRYFPEPDLPPLALPAEELAAAAAAMPELPADKRRRFAALGLPPADVEVLADDAGTAAYFEAALAAGAPPKPAANWVMGDLSAACKEARVGFAELGLAPAALAELLALVEAGTLSGKMAKDLLPDLLAGAAAAPGGVAALVEARGLVQISDAGALEAIVDAVLAANPKQLEQYRGGKTKLAGFFVGQVMKESAGRANPAELNRVLMEKLDGKGG